MSEDVAGKVGIKLANAALILSICFGISAIIWASAPLILGIS